MAAAPRLFDLPAAGLTRVELGEANELLERWGHYLGACNRPFGSDSWVLQVHGEAVSVAVGASTVSANLAGEWKDEPVAWQRDEVVELARLCTDPAQRWATRPMLRLWREVAAPAWPYWPARACVAYSQNEKHEGAIYKFDGWRRIRTDGGSSGGGTWSTKRAEGHAARGAKSLWDFPFEAAA